MSVGKKTSSPAKPAATAEAAPAAAPSTAAAATAAPAGKVDAKPAASAPVEKLSRSDGEGQKAVTDRYRNNWDQIFGKKR